MTHPATTDHRPWHGITQLIKFNGESVCDSKIFFIGNLIDQLDENLPAVGVVKSTSARNKSNFKSDVKSSTINFVYLRCFNILIYLYLTKGDIDFTSEILSKKY